MKVHVIIMTWVKNIRGFVRHRPAIKFYSGWIIAKKFYCETQISKTNNLKVTIGALKFVSRSESQISEA